MRRGIVSNCWQHQLQTGGRLPSLVRQAAAAGYSVFELRQGCLGTYEAGEDHVPDAVRLGELVRECRGFEWDLALAYPCFSPDCDGSDPLFQAGCSAIAEMADGQTPHLRLVDLQSETSGLAAATAAQTVTRLLAMVRGVGGQLSIEHSRQEWSWFREVFERARQLAADDGTWLKICFDPCNLLSDASGPDPAEVTASLTSEEVSMIHLKQRCDGRPAPLVSEGEVDWSAVVTAINAMDDGAGFAGPLLFEIAPGVEIQECLEASRQYLSGLGLDLGEPRTRETESVT